MQGVFNVASNLFAIFPAYSAFVFGSLLIFINSVLEGVISLLYHTCDSFDYCVIDYKLLRAADYIFATNFVNLLTVNFIYWRDRPDYAARGVGAPWLQKIWLFLLFALTLGMTAITGGDIVSQAVILGANVLLIVSYWITYGIRYGSFPRYHLSSFYFGVLLTLSGLTMFFCDNMAPRLFGYTHSLWHVAVFLGAAYLVRIKPPRPLYLNAENKIQQRYEE